MQLVFLSKCSATEVLRVACSWVCVSECACVCALTNLPQRNGGLRHGLRGWDSIKTIGVFTEVTHCQSLQQELWWNRVASVRFTNRVQLAAVWNFIVRCVLHAFRDAYGHRAIETNGRLLKQMEDCGMGWRCKFQNEVRSQEVTHCQGLQEN